MTEPIDEVAVQNLADYNDKKFVDVYREGIDLGTDEQDKKQVRHRSLLKAIAFAFADLSCVVWSCA